MTPKPLFNDQASLRSLTFLRLGPAAPISSDWTLILVKVLGSKAIPFPNMGAPLSRDEARVLPLAHLHRVVVAQSDPQVQVSDLKRLIPFSSDSVATSSWKEVTTPHYGPGPWSDVSFAIIASRTVVIPRDI